MDLTLAIPAHNDRLPLLRLLRRWNELNIPARVIVVDDGSSEPLEIAELRHAAKRDLTLLRHEAAKGPGIARNYALAHVDTDFMLFMDADDLPTRDLRDLLNDLAIQEFDFCLFQHHDTRREKEIAWGQMQYDQNFWNTADLALGALNHVRGTAPTELVQTANYPWNKIYRTNFLRKHSIGCSEILVHEDIELHWRSFLNARHILASDRIGIIHFVNSDGSRLTNRNGPERLALFSPLSRLAKESVNTPYALPFVRFTLGLFLWIFDNLASEHKPALRQKIRHFLEKDVPEEAFKVLKDTSIMAEIQRQLERP